jgi:hypothetical protein
MPDSLLVFSYKPLLIQNEATLIEGLLSARSSLSGRGRNGRLTKHLFVLNTIPNGEQHTGTIRGLRYLAKYKAPDSANVIIYHTE